MRPAAHRAVLLRFALRATLLCATLLAGGAWLSPSGGGTHAAPDARLLALSGAALAAVAVTIVLARSRPRPRVTAPRALSRA